MKSILCPTDFSAASHNAITYAAKLAQVTRCDLTLLTAQSMNDIVPVEFLPGNHLSLKATTARLTDLCSELSRVFNITCKAETESNYFKLDTIIAERSGQYDLLVIASGGAEALQGFFTTNEIYSSLLKTRTPVLIIPEGFLYGEIKRIVYAFDYLAEHKLPLLPLKRFATAVGAEVTVLQVMEEAVSREVDQALRELQFIIKTRNEDFPLKFESVRSAEVTKSIDNFVRVSKPDVLALCSQNRNFIENLFHKSVIKGLSSVSDYPLFVFPE